MERVSVRVVTAPLYAPAQTYRLLDYKLSGGAAQVRTVVADANGRIEFTIDGEGHQISFVRPGTGGAAPLPLPLTSGDRLRLPGGTEIRCRFVFGVSHGESPLECRDSPAD